VFSDGDLWRRQRQLIQPAFHRERITALGEMMVACTRALIERWHVQARSGRSLDVAEEMSKLALEIVAKALFGTDLGGDKDDLTAAVTDGLAYANHLMNHYLTPPLWVPTRVNRDARRVLAVLDRIINRVIAERHRDPRPRGDLLDMLIGARDAETNCAMSDKQLRDEIVTFLVAGHETTAVALAWTWHLLAQHETVEDRLHAAVADSDASSPPALMSVSYVRMTFEESMRLYPPVWGMSRQSYKEDHIGGVRIPPRTVVSVSPYLTHRHPALWDDPERFDPERFSAERSAARPEYAYFPFGGGPRGCIGKQFAMMEAQIVVAMIAQQFRLRPLAGHRIEPHPIFTLRPRGGMPMTVHPR
jgi:cytochrome P450